MLLVSYIFVPLDETKTKTGTLWDSPTFVSNNDFCSSKTIYKVYLQLILKQSSIESQTLPFHLTRIKSHWYKGFSGWSNISKQMHIHNHEPAFLKKDTKFSNDNLEKLGKHALLGIWQHLTKLDCMFSEKDFPAINKLQTAIKFNSPESVSTLLKSPRALKSMFVARQDSY